MIATPWSLALNRTYAALAWPRAPILTTILSDFNAIYDEAFGFKEKDNS